MSYFSEHFWVSHTLILVGGSWQDHSRDFYDKRGTGQLEVGKKIVKSLLVGVHLPPCAYCITLNPRAWCP